MKKYKKAISFLLTAAMSVSFCAGLSVASFAAGETVSAEVKGTYIKSSEPQDITIRLNVSGLTTSYCKFAIDDGTTVPKGFTIKSFSTSNTVQPITGGNYNLNNGQLTYETTDTEDTIPSDTWYEMVVTAPADASGDYDIVFNNISISGVYGTKRLVTVDSVTAKLNIAEASISNEKPYSVALSADKTEVNIGDDVNVYLDVTNSDTSVTSFSSFYGKVTYDKDLVSYAGTSSTEVKESEFYIDNSTPGTLVIKRYGSSVNLSDAHELTLPFKANAKGDAGFTLVGVNDGEKVKIDVDSHAENNALEVKEVTGSPLTVTVKEAASDDPVVSVSLVDYVGSSEANTFKLIIASIDKTGYVPTYDGKKMYQVVGTGYDADKYYYVIPASETYDSNKLSSVEGTTTKLEKDNDINQSNLVDINDAQFVYNIYHGTSPTTNVVERLLLADTSGDQRVETDDCVPIIRAI